MSINYDKEAAADDPFIDIEKIGIDRKKITETINFNTTIEDVVHSKNLYSDEEWNIVRKIFLITEAEKRNRSWVGSENNYFSDDLKNELLNSSLNDKEIIDKIIIKNDIEDNQIKKYIYAMLEKPTAADKYYGTAFDLDDTINTLKERQFKYYNKENNISSIEETKSKEENKIADEKDKQIEKLTEQVNSLQSAFTNPTTITVPQFDSNGNPVMKSNGEIATAKLNCPKGINVALGKLARENVILRSENQQLRNQLNNQNINNDMSGFDM